MSKNKEIRLMRLNQITKNCNNKLIKINRIFVEPSKTIIPYLYNYLNNKHKNKDYCLNLKYAYHSAKN